MQNFDVIIVGAGAAGLMCALTAGQRGQRVLLLEHNDRPGNKILISGGGRCNFTNLDISPECYLSSNPHFFKSALKRYTQWDFIALIEKHEIAYQEKKLGQLFCSQSAKDVLNMLLEECDQAGVSLQTSCEVNEVLPLKIVGFLLNTTKGEFTAASLVIATGGLSLPTKGATGFGYDIARQFGHTVLPQSAGLVPFTFTDQINQVTKKLSGVSIPAEVSFRDQIFQENILFTHRGLSGPAILQISSYWQPGELIHINLMPHLSDSKYFLELKEQNPQRTLSQILSNQETELPKRLVAELEQLFWPEKATEPMQSFSNSELSAIAEQLQNWALKPAGTEGYRTAEVTLGGVDTSQLSSKTMGSQLQTGLFFIGEVVDVSGHLGGYNFQWAWSSGVAAGQCV